MQIYLDPIASPMVKVRLACDGEMVQNPPRDLDHDRSFHPNVTRG